MKVTRIVEVILMKPLKRLKVKKARLEVQPPRTKR
jgi:hypothetical protein